MVFTVEATYENGLLRPALPLPLKEREKVEVVIRTPFDSVSDLTTASPVLQHMWIYHSLRGQQVISIRV